MMTVFVLTRQMDYEGEQVLGVFISQHLPLATDPREWGDYGAWKDFHSDPPRDGISGYWMADGKGECLMLTEFDLHGLIEELP